ncbi:PTS system, mannose-specific IIA component/PTS system, mannose-specific IIB component [Ligilactobacillus sp. WC1T17]|uniref:PTS system, mannose-specific IIA component/PTS system, mannose-specific IIB component n=1 Tax=Ligilactobacillus ruminis TaxID=1623 RepID=A0ABY1A9B9_9LACO|nr:PTS system, mannose-specific IIA component/PTS system, mannose-specific IIB component [Ligilactobacillus ruminis]
MLRLIVASHGRMAQELVESSFMIFGRQEGIEVATFGLNENPTSIKERYQTILARMPQDDLIVFLCDLFGGSPFNAAKTFVDDNPKRFGLIGGVNLAMLLEAYMLRKSDKTMAEIITYLEEVSRYGVNHYESGDYDAF